MCASVRPCRCGHQHNAHSHYRRGTDCAICDSGACVRYRIDKTPAAAAIDCVADALPVDVAVAVEVALAADLVVASDVAVAVAANQ